MDISELLRENNCEDNRLFNNLKDKLILDIFKAGKLIASGLKAKYQFFGVFIKVVLLMQNI